MPTLFSRLLRSPKPPRRSTEPTHQLASPIQDMIVAAGREYVSPKIDEDVTLDFPQVIYHKPFEHPHD